MSESIRDALFWLFSVASVLAGWRVFRTDSMVRAAFWLLGSFVGIGGILLLLQARFLGLVLVLMMAGEMTIMAVFMVMFMMNPAGLNPMMMVHQHRTAVAAGTIAFLGLAAVGTFGEFPARPLASADRVTADLGIELLGDSMLVFETAGVTLLAAMIGSIAIASRWGRYGRADDGSEPPTLAEYARASAADLREPESEKHGPRTEHDSRDGQDGGGA
jgi:NADH:ubiquinone oxidoreductase subunit 6 (subunit J)